MWVLGLLNLLLSIDFSVLDEVDEATVPSSSIAPIVSLK